LAIDIKVQPRFDIGQFFSQDIQPYIAVWLFVGRKSINFHSQLAAYVDRSWQMKILRGNHHTLGLENISSAV
ncbi:MAG: hypothetical protein AAB723_03975, partial [Patescibacteria group bacterium]